MTPWELISTGYPVQTGDPVGSDRITTSPARAGTGEPLHRLEPVPVRPESDRRHALFGGFDVSSSPPSSYLIAPAVVSGILVNV
jgi:hypothetical protein